MGIVAQLDLEQEAQEQYKSGLLLGCDYRSCAKTLTAIRSALRIYKRSASNSRLPYATIEANKELEDGTIGGSIKWDTRGRVRAQEFGSRALARQNLLFWGQLAKQGGRNRTGELLNLPI